MSTNHATRRLPRWVPAIVAGLCVLYIVSAWRPDAAGDFDLTGFGLLPVVDQGRVKPLDTLARTSLLVLSNKQTTYLRGDDGTSERKGSSSRDRVSATRWMLDVMTRADRARTYKVVRIDHPELLGLLGFDPDRRYFSIEELAENGAALNKEIQTSRETTAGDRTPFQRQVLRLANQLNQYFYIEDSMQLLLMPPVAETADWTSIQAAQQDFVAQRAVNPAVKPMLDVLAAWQDQKPEDFNAAVASAQAEVDHLLPAMSLRKVALETRFNRATPFVHVMALYVLVFVMAAVSWLRLSRTLARTALWVLLVGFIVHTGALVARVYIQGRPPVTNLYSSAIFVGWGAVVLGAVLERIYRNGIGAATAAGMGFLTLLVAHHLSLDGDTMTTLQAVLDTNFWLATHVVVITLGYASTFLAGFLGILFVLRGVFTRSLGQAERKSLAGMIYGIVCFATLFSFVGTILGGIWADQSWGRFWGWDPKENGALLIVIWNALILHARWGGLVRQRGLALLAITGNIVTSWSWFGTNMLGVGLHAYGFIDSAIFWMFTFIASQLALIGIGSIPLRRWRSVAAETEPTTPTPAHPATPGPGLSTYVPEGAAHR